MGRRVGYDSPMDNSKKGRKGPDKGETNAAAEVQEGDMQIFLQEKASLVFHPGSGLYICQKCKHGVDVEQTSKFKRHMREKHDIGDEEGERIFNVALSFFGNTEKPKALRGIYRNGSTKANEPVPKIPGIKTVEGQLCGTCSRIFTAGKGFIFHRASVEGDKEAGMTERNTPKLICQNLASNRRHQRLFEVYEEQKNDGLVPSGKEGGPSRLSLSDRLKKRRMSRGISAESKHNTDKADWEKSTFVSMSSCMERLQAYGLTVAEGALLYSAKVTGDCPLITKCIESIDATLQVMFRDAQSIACDWKQSFQFRLDMATPGLYTKTKHFAFLRRDKTGDSSVKKYANKARIPVIIALRLFFWKDLFPKISMGKDLVKSIEAYVSYCETSKEVVWSECEEYKQKLNHVLFQIFFEEHQMMDGVEGLFCNIVYSCLCCTWDERQGNRKKQKTCAAAEVSRSLTEMIGGRVGIFSTATNTGTSLTGIMYSVTCCSVLETYMFTAEESRQDKYRNMTEILQPGSPAGYSLLVQLRSLCTTLRPFEVTNTEFTACNKKHHGLCGITKQVEWSAMEIGDKIRDMHNIIGKLIFEDLLKKKELPEWYGTGLDEMVDNIDDTKYGYNAVHEKRNTDFIAMCTNWLAELTDSDEEHFNNPRWKHNAIKVLKMLFATIHLASGAPGRGTELGSYHVQNTRETRRNIFFRRGEVMLIPHYDKRRVVSKGKIEIISRHTDTATAFLYKSFFIFIYPLLQEILIEELDPGHSKQKIEVLLSMGQVERELMGKEISVQMGKVKCPMDTTTYRHHHTGLIKLKCERENKTADYLNLFGPNEWMEEEDKEDEGFEDLDIIQKAGLQQGAHSVRTAHTMYAQGYSKNPHISLQKHMNKLELNREVSRQWHIECGLLKAEKCSKKELKVETKPLLATNAYAQVEASQHYKTGNMLEPGIGRIYAIAQEIESKLSNPDVKKFFQHASSFAKYASASTWSGPSQSPITPSMNLIKTDTKKPTFESETDADAQVGFGMWVEENVKRNLTNEFNERPEICSAHFHGFSPKKGLEKAVSQNALWNSQEQKRAMIEVAKNESDVLIVITTGGGKSAVVAGPILFESGFTIWVSPLKALKRETESWMGKAGLTVYSIDNIEWDRWKEKGNVIVVSPEIVNLPVYEDILLRLDKNRILNRVVIDEAHLILSHRYFRECMATMARAAKWGTMCNTVMLSATVPESIVADVSKACIGDKQGVVVVRGNPRRKNLQIKVKNVPDKMLENVITAYVKRTIRLFSGNRCIIFCMTVVQVERLFAHFVEKGKLPGSCVLMKYHGGLSEKEGSKMLETWYEVVSQNELKVMVCTDAFGCGINVPNVRHVIVAGGSRTIVDFWQQAGRAGRDGKYALVTVAYAPSTMMEIEEVFGEEYLLRAKCGDFKKWAENEKICRRISIEKILGGGNEKSDPTCNDSEETNGTVYKCDFCLENDAIQTRSQLHRGETCAPGEVLQKSKKDAEMKGQSTSLIMQNKQNRKTQLSLWVGAIRWLRLVHEFLDKKCLYCILIISNRFAQDGATEQQLMELKNTASACRGGCWNVKHCFRCAQTDHWESSKCMYFQYEYKKGDKAPPGKFRCIGCWLGTVAGKGLHSGIGIGRMCGIKLCTKFCLTAYSIKAIQTYIYRNDSPYMQSVERGFLAGRRDGVRRFIYWLTEERPGDRAGIIDMTQFLFRVLKMEPLLKKM